MGKMSRNKGATYEREIATALFDNLGMKFERNLEQVRKDREGDLICEDAAFPFTIECKRRKSGSFSPAWMAQAGEAAHKAGKMPAVVYRMDHGQTRCVVPMCALVAGEDYPVEMSLDAFCFLAREIMAEEWGEGYFCQIQDQKTALPQGERTSGRIRSEGAE